MEITSEMRI